MLEDMVDLLQHSDHLRANRAKSTQPTALGKSGKKLRTNSTQLIITFRLVSSLIMRSDLGIKLGLSQHGVCQTTRNSLGKPIEKLNLSAPIFTSIPAFQTRSQADGGSRHGPIKGPGLQRHASRGDDGGAFQGQDDVQPSSLRAHGGRHRQRCGPCTGQGGEEDEHGQFGWQRKQGPRIIRGLGTLLTYHGETAMRLCQGFL